MGWSIDTIAEEIGNLFDNLNRKYRITHPGAETPIVMIQYEGEIPLTIKKTIVNLFPDYVYIDFVPNSTFPIGSSISPTNVVVETI